MESLTNGERTLAWYEIRVRSRQLRFASAMLGSWWARCLNFSRSATRPHTHQASPGFDTAGFAGTPRPKWAGMFLVSELSVASISTTHKTFLVRSGGRAIVSHEDHQNVSPGPPTAGVGRHLMLRETSYHNTRTPKDICKLLILLGISCSRKRNLAVRVSY